MTIRSRKFTKGIRLKATDEAATLDGEIRNDDTNNRIKVNIEGAEREIVTADQAQTVTNKTIDADNNTISNIETDNLKAGVLITDISTATSDTELPSALAVKTALEGQNEASEIDYATDGTGIIQEDVPASGKTKVQDALDELEAYALADAQDLADHLADTVDAHDASSISVSAIANLDATEVQAALAEHQTDIDGLPDKVETLQNKTLDSTNTFSGSIETPTRSDVKQDTEANLITYAATAADGQIVFATDTQKMYQIVDNELQAIGGGGATSFEINQVAHGFAIGEGIYHNGTTWVKGQANDADTLAYFAIVEVIDVDNFIAADFGRIEVPLHGYTVGEFYFLSDSVAGQATNVEPSSFSNPLFYVEDANTLQVKVYRPAVVGVDLNMDGLSDVSASGAVADDFLQYNGSIWQPARVEQQIISLVAAEGVSAGDALYVNGSGQAALLDADDDNKIEFIGFAKAAALASNPVEIVVSGKLGGFSSLTPGEIVYASASTPGAIVQPEPTQANVYLIKVGKAISATEILVNPDLAASAEFNREVVADLSITNNQAVPTSIAGLSFSGATYRAVVLRYSIYRVTDSNEVAQTGQLRLTYKTNAASWSITDDFGGDDAGVTFSIDATGQVLYASTDLTGTGYSSSLKVNTVELFDV